jgi:hypothetical protein
VCAATNYNQDNHMKNGHHGKEEEHWCQQVKHKFRLYNMQMLDPNTTTQTGAY